MKHIPTRNHFKNLQKLLKLELFILRATTRSLRVCVRLLSRDTSAQCRWNCNDIIQMYRTPRQMSQ